MADVVIVVGATRGFEKVPVAEIRQMVGRAGRKHNGAVCEAYVLVDEEDVPVIEQGMSGDAEFDVESAMTSCDDLVFHILPEIRPGGVSDYSTAAAWYARSFGAFQNKKPNIEKIFERLVEYDAIRMTDKGYVMTDVGRIAADLYFHPADVQAWRNNFGSIFGMGLECDDGAVAWALGNVPIMPAPGDFGKYRFVLTLCRDAIPAALSVEKGTITKIALWWGALGASPMGKMRNMMLSYREDFGRIRRALTELDKIENWRMAGFFEDLEKRINKGIPSYLAELCDIPGINKGRAMYLYNMGIIDRQGIRESLNNLEGEVDDDFMRVLREVANGIR